VESRENGNFPQSNRFLFSDLMRELDKVVPRAKGRATTTMGCGASSSAQASAPSALEGTAREDNASRTPGLQRDPATGAAHADPAPGAPLPPHAETHVAEQGNTSAVEDPLEKAAREAKQTFDARQQRLDAGTEASSPVAG
jgi:hypothetical protein